MEDNHVGPEPRSSKLNSRSTEKPRQTPPRCDTSDITIARQAVADAARCLSQAGIEEPRTTAQLLLANVLSRDRTYILTHPDDILDRAALDEFQRLVTQRANGVPFQYLTGHQEFYGLDFVVSPAVLIPRPETESIIEEVLTRNQKRDPLIIDVGTGSGCLAVTLAVEIRRARVIALDISEPALRVARMNAERHQVEDRILFLASNLLLALLGRGGGRRPDFIVANPPYLPLAEHHALQPQVRDHEPEIALLAGGDGLDFHRRLLVESHLLLQSGGELIMEMGIDQYPALCPLIPRFNWRQENVLPDLRGIPRVLVLRPTREDC